MGQRSPEQHWRPPKSHSTRVRTCRARGACHRASRRQSAQRLHCKLAYATALSRARQKGCPRMAHGRRAP
eukprot:5978653-Prymnesium_polylepis.1